MSSSRKVLWRVPNVGQLRCQKKDPSKLSIYLEFYWNDALQPKKGYEPFFISVRKVPDHILQRKITSVTGVLLSEQRTYEKYRWSNGSESIARIEQFLDLLFAELGRRAK